MCSAVKISSVGGCRYHACKDQAGFTLVEMGMVILISGFLFSIAGFLLTSYMHTLQQEKIDRLLPNAVNAINSYGTGPGRSLHYPCPADPTLPPNDPGYGVPQDCTTLPGTVVTGALPIAVLQGFTGKSEQLYWSLLDPWGGLPIYAVTRSMTDETQTFDQNAGKIRVVDEQGNDTGGTHSDADFVVVVQGPHKGCPADPAIENENCDNDNTFVSSIDNATAGDNHFDDRVVFYSNKKYKLWSGITMKDPQKGPVKSGDVKNDNTGNIGVNINTPQEKLDIVGNMYLTSAAASVKTVLMCDYGTSPLLCIRPESLYNLSCANPNEYIKGVHIVGDQLAADCGPLEFLPPTTAIDCSNGKGGIMGIYTDGTAVCNF